ANQLGQCIQEPAVVVTSGQTKIGVAEVQTHPRVRERKVATLVQRSKEAIEIVRPGEHGVFQGQLEAGFGGQQQGRPQCFNKPLRTLAEVQVQVQQCGADLCGKLDRAVKPAIF